MKNIKIVSLLALALLISFSCADDSKLPFNFKNQDFGAYANIVSITSGSFSSKSASDKTIDAANSRFIFTLEIRDAEQGNTMESYEFLATFVDVNPPLVTKPETSFLTLPASAFTPDATTGYLRATITVSAASILSALSLSDTEVIGGDQFDLRQVLRTKSGRNFTNTNASGVITGGSFFNSPFFNKVPVVCPSDIAGTHDFSTVGIYGGIYACTEPVTGTVTFTPVAGSPGKYEIEDASFGQYDCAWGDSPAAGVFINDTCGKITLSGSDQYALIYELVFVSNNGTNLVIDWFNDYGDGGTTTLTRAGGAQWPASLN